MGGNRGPELHRDSVGTLISPRTFDLGACREWTLRVYRGRDTGCLEIAETSTTARSAPQRAPLCCFWLDLAACLGKNQSLGFLLAQILPARDLCGR